MTITTISSRALNQDVGRAKRAAQDGPVFITDRGKAAHVLLSIEAYRRLAGQERSLAEALAMPDLSAVDFEPPKLKIDLKPLDGG